MCILSIILGNEEMFDEISKLFYDDSNKIDKYIDQLQYFHYFSHQNCYFNYANCIKNIAINFYSIDTKKLLKLPKNILYDIISDQNLKIESEDSLFDFIQDIFKNSQNEDDDIYCIGDFYEQLNFMSLSSDKFREFMTVFDSNQINSSIWEKFSNYMLKIDKSNHSQRYIKINKQAQYIHMTPNYQQIHLPNQIFQQQFYPKCQFYPNQQLNQNRQIPPITPLGLQTIPESAFYTSPHQFYSNRQFYPNQQFNPNQQFYQNQQYNPNLQFYLNRQLNQNQRILPITSLISINLPESVSDINPQQQQQSNPNNQMPPPQNLQQPQMPFQITDIDEEVARFLETRGLTEDQKQVFIKYHMQRREIDLDQLFFIFEACGFNEDQFRSMLITF